jgi:hypothetical protein
MQPTLGSDDDRLDALFRAYANACPGRDPSANFMPELWGRIEARQSYSFSLRRMASTLATAALAFSIALGVWLALPSRSQVAAGQSYVEALAEANAVEAPEIVGPLHMTPAGFGR